MKSRRTVRQIKLHFSSFFDIEQDVIYIYTVRPISSETGGPKPIKKFKTFFNTILK